jgi:hypothetical protein
MTFNGCKDVGYIFSQNQEAGKSSVLISNAGGFFILPISHLLMRFSNDNRT